MHKWICLFLGIIILIFAVTGSAEITIEPVQMPTEASSNTAYVPESDMTMVMLSDAQPNVLGDGAYFENNTLIINQSGRYYLSGTMQGSIEINSQDTDKITLILNGISLSALNQSCLNIISSGKNTTIQVVDGSANIIQCAFTTDVLSQDGIPDAAIYSKADLKLKGNGALYILCDGGKGINCRDDVSIQNLNLTISATDDGLRGKDSVNISSGLIHISAGADGIRSTNEEKEDKGTITISGGEVLIDAALDAVQAYNTLSVSGGHVVCISGGGAKESAEVRQDDFQRGFPGGRGGAPGWDMNRSNNEMDESSDSTKGLKSDLGISISGGRIEANSLDDALHSNQNITISGGELLLYSGDDGIHADNALFIQGGTISVMQSYEGIEAADLQISGGETRIIASDDGVNAAGAEKENTFNGGSFGGHRGGFGGGMLSETSGQMTISGGYLLVNSSGDGVDVNGATQMSGGTLIIYGPSNHGNAALDYDETFLVTGGTLLATGSYGMAQTVTTAENVDLLAFTCNIPPDTLLHIADADDTQILTFASEKEYSCVVFASDMIHTGNTYKIYAQGEYSLPAIDGLFTDGEYTPGTLLGTIDL